MFRTGLRVERNGSRQPSASAHEGRAAHEGLVRERAHKRPGGHAERRASQHGEKDPPHQVGIYLLNLHAEVAIHPLNLSAEVAIYLLNLSAEVAIHLLNLSAEISQPLREIGLEFQAQSLDFRLEFGLELEYARIQNRYCHQL